VFFVNCAVPENIHPPRDWIRVSWVVGGSVGTKYLKKCVGIGWKLKRGGGGGGGRSLWKYRMKRNTTLAEYKRH